MKLPSLTSAGFPKKDQAMAAPMMIVEMAAAAGWHYGIWVFIDWGRWYNIYDVIRMVLTLRGGKMFRKKKAKISPIEFNKETQKAVLKCSICTGEQIACFKDIKTGHLTEVMLIKTAADLDEFCRMYDLENVPKEY